MSAARRVALFVPCYIDQFYPQVGIAALRLLEQVGLTVAAPRGQTCCGQPMANAGFEHESERSMRHFVDIFASYDYIVAPSGSCVLHVHERFGHLGDGDEVTHVVERTMELCQFLVDVVGVTSLPARFPHRVGLHNSCHGLRGLRLGQSSERRLPDFSKVKQLLAMVEGLELVDLSRPDECCGFGGTFAVSQPALSAAMGRDRLADHLAHGAEYVTATDMSCLMHLEGLARREGMPIKTLHVAEILTGGPS